MEAFQCWTGSHSFADENLGHMPNASSEFSGLRKLASN